LNDGKYYITYDITTSKEKAELEADPEAEALWKCLLSAGSKSAGSQSRKA
jgi:hypothetical protein